MSESETSVTEPGNKGAIHSSAKRSKDENRMDSNIAICGIGIRLPGDIRSTKTFWDLMTNDTDAQLCAPVAQDNEVSTGGRAILGGFLSEGTHSFDAPFFSLTEERSTGCELYDQKLLEIARECLEDACEVDYHGSGASVACYVAMPCRQDTGMNRVGQISTANRVSRQYGLEGPR